MELTNKRDSQQSLNEASSLENFKPEQYEHIELTRKETAEALLFEMTRLGTNHLSDEQEKEALRKGRRKKEGEIAQMKYFESLKQEPTILKLNRDQILKFVANRLFQNGKTFEIDEWNSQIILSLAEYFTDDPEFERRGEGYSLKKGILLFGNVGCGKTYLMNAFTINPKMSFGIFSARSINVEYAQHGWEVSNKYSKLFSRVIPVFGQTKIGLCIDDLGTEEDKKHYGDKASAVNDILENRYHNEEVPFIATHITMNLTSEEIESFYGSRLKDRMRESFNVLTFDAEAPSRRK